MRTTFRLLILVGVVGLSSSALAHARWVYPTPRSTSDNIKTGPPCGVGANAGVRRANVTTLTAGSILEVSWRETIAHFGHYELLFSPAGDQNFVPLPLVDGGLADRIPDPEGSQGNQLRQVVLPATPCTDCTLRMVQAMYARQPDGGYYLADGGVIRSDYMSCADISLVAPPVGDGGIVEDAGTVQDAGAVEDAGSPQTDAGVVSADGGTPLAVDAGVGGSQPAPGLESGCGANATGGTVGGVFTLLVVGGLLARRRGQFTNRSM